MIRSLLLLSLLSPLASRAEVNLAPGDSIDHGGTRITCGEKRTEQDNFPDVFCGQGRKGICYLSATQSYCYGNYFSSLDNCQKSKQAIMKTQAASYACFQSESRAGLAYLASIKYGGSKIQNYFPSLDSCLQSISRAAGSRVCLPSESRPGQFFMGNVDTGGNPIGGYYPSQDACIRAL